MYVCTATDRAAGGNGDGSTGPAPTAWRTEVVRDSRTESEALLWQIFGVRGQLECLPGGSIPVQSLWTGPLLLARPEAGRYHKAGID